VRLCRTLESTQEWVRRESHPPPRAEAQLDARQKNGGLTEPEKGTYSLTLNCRSHVPAACFKRKKASPTSNVPNGGSLAFSRSSKVAVMNEAVVELNLKTDVPGGAGLNSALIELSAARSGFDISAKPLGETVFVTNPTTFSEKTCPTAGARVTAVIAAVRSKIFVLIKFACFVSCLLFFAPNSIAADPRNLPGMGAELFQQL